MPPADDSLAVHRADGNLFAPRIAGDPAVLPLTGAARPDPHLFEEGVDGCEFRAHFVPDPGTDWGYIVDDTGVHYCSVTGDHRVFVPAPAAAAATTGHASAPTTIRDHVRQLDESTRRTTLRLGVDTTYASGNNQYVLFTEEDAPSGSLGCVRYHAILSVTVDEGRRLVANVSVAFMPAPGERWADGFVRENPILARRPAGPLVAEAIARLQRWHDGERHNRDAGGRVITSYERWCRSVAQHVAPGPASDGVIAGYGAAALAEYGPVPPPFGR